MKFILSCWCLAMATCLFAQEPGNYKPDNTRVALGETNLPIVYITTNHRQIDREERITARMKIIHNGEGRLNYGDTLAHPGQKVDYDGFIGLKYRGNSSFTNSDKKPYAIRPLNKSLEEGGKKQKVSILGMGKDDDWALLAPYADKSMIRDVMSFTLARSYFEYVPNSRYCEMIMDGIYYGVFILSERVRKGKSRLDIGDPEGESGDGLTGGYHLEVDRDDEAVYKSRYSPVDKQGNPIAGKKISFQYKSPEYDELTDAQRNYIHGYIDEMEATFASSYYKDPKTGYRKYIDVTSFIDYMLSTEFAHNGDGYRLSTNLYKYRNSIDPRFKTSLWDMNLGFGNANYYGAWKTDTWIYNFNSEFASQDAQLVPFWWYKMMQDESYVREMKERWEQYRDESYTDAHITHVIDSLTTLLNKNGAQERNSKAWPRWGRYVWPNQYVATSYDDEISYLKGWIKSRLIFMDKELLNRIPESPKSIPLTITAGLNEDVIAEQRPARNYSSVSVDGQDWVFISDILQPGTGLPANGNIESSAFIRYQLADYTKNNALLMKSVGNGELLFKEQVATSGLYLLGTSTNGFCVVKITVCYTDGTEQSATISYDDWSGDINGTAVYGLDRIGRDKDNFDGRAKYRLFERSVPADENRTISKLKISKTSGGNPVIFAVSAIEKKAVGMNNPQSEGISVYPNPVSKDGAITIAGATGQVALATLDGKILQQETVSGKVTELPVNGMSSGIYLLIINDGNEKKSIKIIVE